MREYLKNAREDMNLTQKDVALFLGISQNYYSDIENGIRQKKIKVDTLIGLSEVLQIPISDMLHYENTYSKED